MATIQFYPLPMFKFHTQATTLVLFQMKHQLHPIPPFYPSMVSIFHFTCHMSLPPSSQLEFSWYQFQYCNSHTHSPERGNLVYFNFEKYKATVSTHSAKVITLQQMFSRFASLTSKFTLFLCFLLPCGPFLVQANIQGEAFSSPSLLILKSIAGRKKGP